MCAAARRPEDTDLLGAAKPSVCIGVNAGVGWGQVSCTVSCFGAQRRTKKRTLHTPTLKRYCLFPCMSISWIQYLLSDTESWSHSCEHEHQVPISIWTCCRMMIYAAFAFGYFTFLIFTLCLCCAPLHGCENLKIILSSLEGLLADKIGTRS